jgi:hypothetical protein
MKTIILAIVMVITLTYCKPKPTSVIQVVKVSKDSSAVLPQPIDTNSYRVDTPPFPTNPPE